jgi:ankyrin repeat protein
VVTAFRSDVKKEMEYCFDAVDRGIRRGHMDMVLWVIEQGVDPGDCNASSWENVEKSGNLELMKFLVSKVRRLNWKAFRALYWLSLNGIETSGFSLSEKLSQVNAQDRYGRTVLHYASERNYHDCVKWLVTEFNADFNITDNGGIKPAELFDMKKMERDFLEWLVMEANVDTIGTPPEPVLHRAAKEGNRKLVEWLVHVRKVDVSQVDENGRTALDVYVHTHSRESVDDEVYGWLAGDLNQDIQLQREFFAYLQSSGAELAVVKEWGR